MSDPALDIDLDVPHASRPVQHPARRSEFAYVHRRPASECPGEVAFCTWMPTNDLSGESGGEIAIENSPGPTFATIAPSDVAFKTDGCEPWEKVG
jgi:hypothetical protein